MRLTSTLFKYHHLFIGQIPKFRGSALKVNIPKFLPPATKAVQYGLWTQWRDEEEATKYISTMFNQTASMSYDNSNKTHQTIHNLITGSKKSVFVFMKGVPSEPLCRYSGVVVQILDAYGVEYDSCDVLENSEIRQEIKSYSDWPTIPQVYMDGSFIGGCDILLQMHQSGELKKLFGGEAGGGGGSESSSSGSSGS